MKVGNRLMYMGILLMWSIMLFLSIVIGLRVLAFLLLTAGLFLLVFNGFIILFGGDDE